MTIIHHWCWSEGEITNLLTLNTLRPKCSFAVNKAVSMRPIITSWRGVVFPRRAPNEISNVAVARSADKSLKYMKNFNIHTYIISSVHNSVVQQSDMKLVREKHYIQTNKTIQYKTTNIKATISNTILSKA